MGTEPSQTQTPAFWESVIMFHLSWIWGHNKGRCRHHSGKLRWCWRAWMLLSSWVLQIFLNVLLCCVYTHTMCVSTWPSVFVQSRRQLCKVRALLLCIGSGNELRPSDLRSKCLDLLSHLQLSSWSSWSKPWGWGRTHGFNTGSFRRQETSL